MSLTAAEDERGVTRMAKQKSTFGTLTPQEAGRLGAQRRREKREREEAAEFGPVVTDEDRDAIIRALKQRAQNGDHLAAKELREWVEIRKENEDRAGDKQLLELLSPITRDLIAAELHAGGLPADLLELIDNELNERELLPDGWPHVSFARAAS
jgi:hypothetical protein